MGLASVIGCDTGAGVEYVKCDGKRSGDNKIASGLVEKAWRDKRGSGNSMNRRLIIPHGEPTIQKCLVMIRTQ